MVMVEKRLGRCHGQPIVHFMSLSGRGCGVNVVYIRGGHFLSTATLCHPGHSSAVPPAKKLQYVYDHATTVSSHKVKSNRE